MSNKIITFKATPIKSRDRYYIYIPKQWNDELEEYYRNRKRVKVTIELEER